MPQDLGDLYWENGVSNARRQHPKRAVTCPNERVTRGIGSVIRLRVQSQRDVLMGNDTRKHTGNMHPQTPASGLYIDNAPKKH